MSVFVVFCLLAICWYVMYVDMVGVRGILVFKQVCAFLYFHLLYFCSWYVVYVVFCLCMSVYGLCLVVGYVGYVVYCWYDCMLCSWLCWVFLYVGIVCMLWMLVVAVRRCWYVGYFGMLRSLCMLVVGVFWYC